MGSIIGHASGSGMLQSIMCLFFVARPEKCFGSQHSSRLLESREPGATKAVLDARHLNAVATLVLTLAPSTRCVEGREFRLRRLTRLLRRRNQRALADPKAALPSMAQLPPSIAAAREAASWPLHHSAHPPLFYLPLMDLRVARDSSKVPLGVSAAALADDPFAAIASLGGSDYARVAVALLLLAGGGADECHSLVTPLSWPDGTTFGGPAILGSVAAELATHAHALVHRKEAWHIGEFGTGWQNSGYWYGSVLSPAAQRRFAKMQALAADAAAGDDARQQWFDANLLHSWAPREINNLLNDVLVDSYSAEQGKESRISESLKSYAEELALIELTVLLDECLEMCCESNT